MNESELIEKVAKIIEWGGEHEDEQGFPTNKADAQEIIQLVEADVKGRCKEVLKGIDETETDSGIGWWETSTGAEFGVTILKQIDEA